MLSGVALSLSEFSSDLIALHHLGRLIHTRDDERELQFLFAAAERRLPVLVDGQLVIARWGNRRGESKLPLSGWTWRTSVEAGAWTDSGAEMAVIPARWALDKGIWYRVSVGVEALLVRDEHGTHRAYPIVQPAGRYYCTMTKSEWMPCLFGEGAEATPISFGPASPAVPPVIALPIAPR